MADGDLQLLTAALSGELKAQRDGAQERCLALSGELAIAQRDNEALKSALIRLNDENTDLRRQLAEAEARIGEPRD